MTANQRMLRYLSHHKLRLMAGVACILAMNIAKVVSPAILQRAVDSVAAARPSFHVLEYGGFIVAAATIQGIFVFLHRQLVLGISRDIERDLRNDCYRHLQSLAFVDIQAVGSIGDLTARVTNDIGKAILGAGQALVFLLNTAFTVLIVVIAMTLLSWKLAAAVLIPLLFTAAVIWRLDHSVKAKAASVQALFGRISSHIQETLSAVRTVRAYLQDQAKLESFQNLNQQYAVESLKLRRLSVLLPPLLQFLMGISFVVLLWYGGRLTAAGTLTVGEYVQFAVYLGYLAWPIAESGWGITVLQQGLASMARVHSILSKEPAIKDLPCAVSEEIAGSIELRDLSFQYPQSIQPAIDGISLKINHGSTVAIVGPIGSGKSTLMHIVPRLLDCAPGQLLIDGRPAQEIAISTLRASLGYVPQKTFLFSDTVASNIAFGMDGVSQQQIEQAATQAGIAEEIAAFPAGYQTLLGEQGVTLSGGQRQRIGIARALIRYPRILLLDDVFSSVDAFTEANILQHFQKFMAGRTCLISSHRISAIKNADWIVVLRQGQIAEQGTHRELLSSGGLYAEMHERQLLEEQLNMSS